MSKQFQKGDKVSVPHGTGTVIQIEKLDVGTRFESTGRYEIELDDGHTWTFENSLYYAWPKEMVLLK